MRHPFFKALKNATQGNGFGAFGVNQAAFFKILKKAHPFVFDKKVSEKAMEESSNYKMLEHDSTELVKVRDVEQEIGKVAEDFSLPFSTSLYLVRDIPTVVVSPKDRSEPFRMRMHGYLINEQTPEKFDVYVIEERTVPESIRKKVGATPDDFFPVVDHFMVDLGKLATASNTEETLFLARLTAMISVKRIGIEHGRSMMNFKSGGSGIGITTIKYDNLYHIADKVEYHYAEPVTEDAEIQWDYRGHWRGHWRAFYVKDSKGDNIQDQRGWNVVDYGRNGKNRQGTKNVVPGYTWVVEHTKGNPEIAEIKTHLVK